MKILFWMAFIIFIFLAQSNINRGVRILKTSSVELLKNKKIKK